jgi:hypothetical protein
MKPKIHAFCDATLCPWVSSFDILKYHVAFIFTDRKNISHRLLYSQDEGTVVLRNATGHKPNNTASHPRGHETSATPL